MATLALALMPIEPALAVQLLAGVEHLDPTGRTDHAALARICQEAECFGVSSVDGAAQAVFVLSQRPDGARIHWARAWGPVDMTATVLPVIERRCAGALSFQTARRGLVRKARRQGYEVIGRAGRGWNLRKNLA